MTKSVALETATTRITANSVCPGWVLTPLVEAQLKAKAEQNGVSYEQATHDLLREKHPSLQFTRPEEIGELVAYMCSEAAANVRGVAWQVDGAWTAV
jgi:3-hydroxybutyrate dehydrogenase